MTTLAELLGAHSSLTTLRVERWVARGLLRPTPDGPESWSFEQVDIARVRLLAELGDDLGGSLGCAIELEMAMAACSFDEHAVLRCGHLASVPRLLPKGPSWSSRPAVGSRCAPVPSL